MIHDTVKERVVQKFPFEEIVLVLCSIKAPSDRVAADAVQQIQDAFWICQNEEAMRQRMAAIVEISIWTEIYRILEARMGGAQ